MRFTGVETSPNIEPPPYSHNRKFMTAETAQHQGAASERPAAPVVSDTVDFSPPKTSTWSDIASQCWNGDLKGCVASAGQKIGDALGIGGSKEQDLVKGGTIPDLSIVQDSADTRAGVTAEARAEGFDTPKALQGDNKKRTETVMNSKADPQDRLKAASELVSAGVTSFSVQSADGAVNKVRLEKEEISKGRSMLGVYVSGKNGGELNALRAIQNADGSLNPQKDANGKAVDYKNRGVALLDRLSDNEKTIGEGTKPGGKDTKTADKRRTDADKEAKQSAEDLKKKPEERLEPAKKEPEKPGEWKSPYERKYGEGDKFKGITSVYWEDSSTASGIRFNKNELTAASREFPFGTVLKVRNPENGKETRVVITDNGPFAGKKEARPDGSEKVHNRVLDISLGAANAIGMKDTTPRAMEITVESIPADRAWGNARRNLRKDGKEELLAQVKRITADGRT